jgi:hypothetical protein
MSSGSKKLKQEPRMARHCRSPMLRAERKRNDDDDNNNNNFMEPEGSLQSSKGPSLVHILSHMHPFHKFPKIHSILSSHQRLCLVANVFSELAL